MNQQRGPWQGMAGGIFMIFLVLAIISHGFFLPIFFVGLGLASLLGATVSRGSWREGYGGFLGFVFFLGLASCSLFDWWWPGIMITIAVVAILSSFSGYVRSNIMGGRFGSNPQSYQPPQPSYQPPPPNYQPPQPPYSAPQERYQPPVPPYGGYQEGYQPPQQTPPMGYPDSSNTYDAPPVVRSPYDQPQAEYPPQEMPPQR